VAVEERSSSWSCDCDWNIAGGGGDEEAEEAEEAEEEEEEEEGVLGAGQVSLHAL
jgi:hypothetical protein